MTTTVLVLAQTPPPFGGQTVMTQALVAGDYDDIEIRHVPLNLSSDLKDMGSASLRKIVRLFTVTFRATSAAIRMRPDVLYYVPGGDQKSAIARDLLLLPLVRPWADTTVFHFHAQGLEHVRSRLPAVLGPIASLAYSRPDLAIGPSAVVASDAQAIDARRFAILPNGSEGGAPKATYELAIPPRLLFLNLISEAKGIFELIDAHASVVREYGAVQLHLVGEVESEDTLRRIGEMTAALGTEDLVEVLPPRVGNEKWSILEQSDIFCFPTKHPTETFGLVLVEAASCGLPVIATSIPGVADVLEAGKSIILTPSGDAASLADSITSLLNSTALRQSIGTKARQRFETHYTLRQYRWEISNLLKSVGAHESC